MVQLTALLLSGSLVLGASELSGRRAPGFALPDLDVNFHDLYDYRGKVVLLDILKTDCPVCNTSQRIFETIRQKFANKVAVLGVVTMPDSQDTVRRFVAQHGLKTPVLFDCSQMIASYLKLTPKKTNIGLPHLFLIDAKGMIRKDWEYKSGNEKYFESLEPLLSEVTALVKEIPAPAPSKPESKGKKK
jgi:peroxiredoxin